MEIEKNDFSFRGPPPPFSAHGRSRLGMPPRPPLVRPSPPRAHGLPQCCAAPFPRAASRPAPERDRRVATMRRRRPPHGSHGLPRPPRVRLLLPDHAASSSFLPPLSLRRSASSSRARHELATDAAAAPPAAYPLPRLHSSIPAAEAPPSIPASLAAAVVEVRTKLGRLLPLRRARCRG